jgi:hypothetical protein
MRVICEAGYSGCDHPKAFSWQGNSLSVKRIIKEWREPGTKLFLVTAGNSDLFKLGFSEISGCWNILEVSSSSNS